MHTHSVFIRPAFTYDNFIVPSQNLRLTWWQYPDKVPYADCWYIILHVNRSVLTTSHHILVWKWVCLPSSCNVNYMANCNTPECGLYIRSQCSSSSSATVLTCRMAFSWSSEIGVSSGRVTRFDVARETTFSSDGKAYGPGWVSSCSARPASTPDEHSRFMLWYWVCNIVITKIWQ